MLGKWPHGKGLRADPYRAVYEVYQGLSGASEVFYVDGSRSVTAPRRWHASVPGRGGQARVNCEVVTAAAVVPPRGAAARRG